ncbi:MAG: lmo0937 family membrane protein [Chloroflexota bacterium]|jgi:hypothetical protein
MLWTIIVILLILWLLGFVGGSVNPRFRTGNWIHTLLVIVVILFILQLLGVM